MNQLQEVSNKIRNIVLISGKRKCGKDYFSEKLQKRLGHRSQIIRISEPIKSEWAKRLQLDLKELLSDGPYKEQYRKDMIVWSERERSKDYGCFCRAALKKADAEIIIVSDIRRKTDIKYFKDTFGTRVITVRLICPEDIRAARGWIYTEGIDDLESECDLDDYTSWDLVLENDSDMGGEKIIDLFLEKFQFL